MLMTKTSVVGVLGMWVLVLAVAGGGYAADIEPTRALAPIATTPVEIAPAAAATPEATVETIDVNAVLRHAAELAAQGQFTEAEQELAPWSGPGDQSLDMLSVRELLYAHTELLDEMQQARRDAYDEHVAAMQEAMQNAQWRQDMLLTSQAYDMTTDAKTTFEEELREDVDKDWGRALAKLTLAENLADRVGLDDRVDEETKEQIIARVLAIAGEHEKNHEWLDAYGRVYYYLTALDRRSSEYDDHVDRLLRQASITAMYHPDPNEEGVTWQQRREGVLFNMVDAGLYMAQERFVEQVDFHGMTVGGLKNCLLLAETDALSQAFPQLDDTEAAEKYRMHLRTMLTELEQAEELMLDSRRQVLEVFSLLMHVNSETLKFPDEVLMAEFGEGAFMALDPYTYVVWPGDVQEFRKDMTNEFFGVGIVINKKNGLLTVDSLLDDGPALHAGMDAGDTILAVDGKSTGRITLDMAVRLITGPENTPVVLTIDRESFDEPQDFTVIRQRIVVRTVKGLYRDEFGDWQHWVDPASKIGYVRIESFAGETPQRLREVMEQLRGDGMAGLVLDLRDNSGGYLSGAIAIVDDFIAEGEIVSRSSPRDPASRVADSATSAGTFDTQLPLVVLVNGNSASASEIVSGALRDHERALIVGTRTFGKGSVQEIHAFRPTKAEMKITVAYYYLPSGRRVHRDPKDKLNEDYGVEPHVTLEMTGEQMSKRLQVRRDATILRLRGNGDNDDAKTYTADDILESDPQLQLALLCMRSRLVADGLQSELDTALAAGVRTTNGHE